MFSAERRGWINRSERRVIKVKIKIFMYLQHKAHFTNRRRCIVKSKQNNFAFYIILHNFYCVQIFKLPESLLMFLPKEWENKSTEKNTGSSWDSNTRPSEYSSDALTIKPLGPLAEKRKTSYIKSMPRGLSQIPTDSHFLRAGLNWNPGSTLKPLKSQSDT